MKAVILVGGKATRLEPLTYNTPKAVVPVLNTPVLENVICHLGRHQITDIILAQGHLAQPIEGYLGNGSQFGVKLSYTIEDTPLGTAGAIKNAERYLGETFLVLNSDIFTDLDITAMIDYHREKKAKATIAATPLDITALIDYHREKKAEATIAATPVDDPTSYGLIETNFQGRITRFPEKPSWSKVTPNMINAGTYILEPDILAQIPPQKEVSIERETFQQLLTQGRPIYTYPSSAYWIDVGTPERYLQLHRDLLSVKCQQYALAPDKEVLIGEQSNIHSTTQIKGSVLIGANCSIGRGVKLNGLVVIGDNCTILEDSLIEDSIIWRNARLGPRVRLKNTILAHNCCLKAGSICEESVLGDGVTVGSNCKLEPGSRIQPGTTVEAET